MLRVVVLILGLFCYFYKGWFFKFVLNDLVFVLC